MYVKIFVLTSLFLQGCLFFDGSSVSDLDVQRTNNQTLQTNNGQGSNKGSESNIGVTNSNNIEPEPNCDGKIVDFDIVALDGEFRTVESCPGFVILKSAGNQTPRIIDVLKFGSQKVSIANSNRGILIGTEDKVFVCTNGKCEKDASYMGAEEVKVASWPTLEGEEGYLVKFPNKINLYNKTKNFVKPQTEPRMGDFSNLQINAFPFANNTAYIATAQSDGNLHWFLRGGEQQICPIPSALARGVSINDGELSVVYPQNGLFSLLKITSKNCGSPTVGEGDPVETFDVYNLSGLDYVAARQYGNKIHLMLVDANLTLGDPEDVEILVGEHYEVAGTYQSYALGVLHEGNLNLHFGTFK